MSKRDWDHVEPIGLDDLLTPYEPADEAKPRDRPFPMWLVRSILFALVVSAGVWAVLHTLAIGVPFPLLLVLTLTISGLRRTLGAVAAPPLPLLKAPLEQPDEHGDGTLADGLFLAVNRWDTRLSWTDRDRVAFGTTILPRLAEIMDERLRLRHGVTRMSDPARTRRLMGERLWSLLHVPVGRYPTPHEFAAIVADMEAL
jgi:hypothetical protein